MFGVCMIAGIAFFAVIPSALGFQQAVIQSPKAAAIANLKYEMKNLTDSIELVRQQAKKYHDKIFELTNQRETIYSRQDALGISSESFRDVLRNLQGQRIELMIDLAGIDARRDALTETQENEINATSASSAVSLLTRLVELSKDKLDQAKQLHANGSISSMEINTIEKEYLTAQLKLTSAKKPVQVSPLINEELLSVSLDRAEKQARLVKIEELLKTIIASREALLENEEISANIAAAKRKQDSLRAQSEDLENRLRLLDRKIQSVMQED